MVTGSVGLLNDAYRAEKDVDIRERILLVRRVRINGEEAAGVAEKEFHRSRWWAYKWLKRFDTDGLDGLKNQPRSGRPPEVPEKKMLQIRKELSENRSGWQVMEVMNMIYKKTGVMYHEVHVYRLLHKWGFSSKVPQKRFVNTSSKEEKEAFKKEHRRYSPVSRQDSS